MILGWLFTIAWMAGLTGLAVALWRVGLQGIFDALERVIVRLAHGPQRRPLPPRTPPRPLAPAGCAHRSPPVPVEVHDARDGATEVARWLCPDCTEEVPAPRPAPPAGRGATAMPEPDPDILCESSRKEYARQLALRRIIEEAAWAKLSPEERARRNEQAVRIEGYLAGGIISPREAVRIREEFNARPNRITVLGDGIEYRPL